MHPAALTHVGGYNQFGHLQELFVLSMEDKLFKRKAAGSENRIDPVWDIGRDNVFQLAQVEPALCQNKQAREKIHQPVAENDSTGSVQKNRLLIDAANFKTTRFVKYPSREILNKILGVIERLRV